MSEEVKREAAKREAERNEDWRMTGDSYCNGWDRGFDVGWNAAASRWHSIEREGLPSEEGEYLVTVDTAYNEKRRMRLVQVQGYCTDDGQWETQDVTAWMPLPSPYTGDDAEER